jgi:hypothetical protein
MDMRDKARLIHLFLDKLLLFLADLPSDKLIRHEEVRDELGRLTGFAIFDASDGSIRAIHAMLSKGKRNDPRPRLGVRRRGGFDVRWIADAHLRDAGQCPPCFDHNGHESTEERSGVYVHGQQPGHGVDDVGP